MSGIEHYINDLNTRFTNQLFTDKIRKFWGLSRIDISGIPYINESGEYRDVLFNDKYDISIFYVENGDRKIKSYSFESKIDLIVTVNIKKFSEYSEEDIVEKVYQIMKVTAFKPEGFIRDVGAIKEFNYQEKIKETLYPYFVFRIKCKLVGILKQKENGI